MAVLTAAGLVSDDLAASLHDLPCSAVFDQVCQMHRPHEQVVVEAVCDELGISSRPLVQWHLDPSLTRDADVARAQGMVMMYDDEDRCGVLVDNPYAPVLSELSARYERVDVGVVSSHDLATFYSDDDVTELDDILSRAVRESASDVHFYRKSDRLSIWFRIDGKLVEIVNVSEAIGDTLLAQAKFRSDMDVSLSHRPQDGRLSWRHHGQRVDVRVSVIPSVYGEDMVCRLFRTDTVALDDCGFSDHEVGMLQSVMAQSSGLFIVTGPTGSGKTTTLYSLLNELKGSARNIVSIEDPVETVLDHVRQTQVSASYTFGMGLRAMLRQDPDVILVGEIRDPLTAKTALEAAYTGHLVLASLHTHTIDEAKIRLQQLGCDPVQLSGCLRGILAQKLVPKPCECETGCVTCRFTGFVGRQVQADVMVA